jgi:endonuclease G
MKKIFLSLLVLFSMSVAANSAPQAPAQPLSACQVQSPWGFANTQRTGLVALCHYAYLTVVDPQAKIPVYVSYTLTPQHALGCLPRTDAFAADASLPGGATPTDYAGSGYDKGHVAPDGDMSWDNQAELESFLMTNMLPQLPSLNRGIWKLLETSVRGWSFQQNKTFTIYAGPLYGAGDKTIGRGVVVPHGFFKIVIDDTTGAVAGWQFPHAPNQGNLGNDLTKFRVPVAQIEKTAGIQFAFPATARELNPGQEWPVDFGKLTQAKRQKCGANAAD